MKIFGDPAERGIVGLRAIDTPLLRPLEWSSPHWYRAPQDWDWPDRILDRIAAEIREEFPRAAQTIGPPALATAVQPAALQPGATEPDAGELRHQLEAIAGAARSASGERRAALWLAADQLAIRYAQRVRPSGKNDGWDPKLEGIRFYDAGAHFGDSGPIEYSRGLLGTIWRDPIDSEWKEYALLYLQDLGWHGCDDWEKAYEKVIDRGESYLERLGTSSFRATQLAFIATAYESKYFVYRRALDPAAHAPGTGSLSEPNLPDIDDPAAAADAALAAAVRYYTELSTEFPEAPEARFARWRLRRLKTGLLPNQWTYAGYLRC